MARNVVAVKHKLEVASGVGADLGLVDMDSPNAFAFHQQGRPVIAFSLSWLDRLGQDVDALATTIGHELAHLYLGHTGAAREEREKTAQGASQVVGTALSLAGVPMGGAIANVGATALARSFTRDEERAADDYGIRWAVAAGYDPCGRARTMKMYQDLSAGTVDIPFLSTHPGAAERSNLADAYSLRTNNRPCAD
ncbi:MAG TPA: M48 family metalloprotease [Burkholderiales bacterium]|nr:M48 family metalloprotease [Burkholderiales bacterium]